jgi:hypothetical protein
MPEAAFEAELRAWVDQVYRRRGQLARRRVEARVFELLERERRWLTLLTIVVMLGIYGTPFIGAASVAGGLAALYIGSIASGLIAVRYASRVERSVDPSEPVRAAAEAWETRPALDPARRARLLRLMNLFRVAHLPGARELLVAELGELSADPDLAGWRLIRDLKELILAERSALG